MNFIYNPMTNRIEPVRVHPTIVTLTTTANLHTFSYRITS